ncbi:MAG: phosphate--acyl-ACP acyltransferase, partial [Dehalococcoidia bacterium]
MRIALDAMGGERAPHELVRGAVEACRENCGEIVLVGKESVLGSELESYHHRGLKIVNADEVVDFEEHPAQAVRQKQDSSIVVGMNLLK